MSLKFDMLSVTGDNKATNFSAMLLRLIFKADPQNREKLRKGFPNAVRMVERFKDGLPPLDLPYD